MERLRRHSDFVAVLRQRRKLSDKDVVLHFVVSNTAKNLSGDTTKARRLGLAVSKAVGGAVTRNLIKRRFRVLAKRYEHNLPECCDIVLRAKPSVAETSFRDLEPQIEALFTAVAQQRPRHEHKRRVTSASDQDCAGDRS